MAVQVKRRYEYIGHILMSDGKTIEIADEMDAEDATEVYGFLRQLAAHYGGFLQSQHIRELHDYVDSASCPPVADDKALTLYVQSEEAPTPEPSVFEDWKVFGKAVLPRLTVMECTWKEKEDVA